jgi:hypothetical protein
MWLKPTPPKGDALLLDLVIKQRSAREWERHRDSHLLNEFGLVIVLLLDQLQFSLDRGLFPTEG